MARPDTSRLPLLRERAFIGGEWVAADSGRSLPVRNPADGAVLGHVPDMEQGETRRAIAAAEAAMPAWAARPARERAAILETWFDLMVAAREDLAQLALRRAGQAAGRSAG